MALSRKEAEAAASFHVADHHLITMAVALSRYASAQIQSQDPVFIAGIIREADQDVRAHFDPDNFHDPL
jgi:hypothetical protein